MKYISLMLISILISGCNHKLIQPREAHPSTAPLSVNESGLIFYRGKGNDAIVPTIVVNNHTVGSLLPNRFAEVRVCKGMATVGMSGVHGEEIRNNPQVAVPGAGNLYFKVIETKDGNFSLVQVEEKSAQQELDSFNMQSHIINRYIPDCTLAPIPAPPPPPPIVIIEKSEPIVLQRINLSADALFVFGKSLVRDMFPKGRASLDALAKEIQTSSMTIETLKVSGYTDRLGRADVNKKLSYARAQTVAEYLRSKGVTIPIEAVGYGEKETVATWCVGTKRTPKLIECLQPDRRVSVDLIGQKTLSK